MEPLFRSHGGVLARLRVQVLDQAQPDAQGRRGSFLQTWWELVGLLDEEVHADSVAASVAAAEETMVLR